MNTTKWILVVSVASPINSIPQDLYNKLSTLLKRLRIRKASIRAELLLFLPSVLVELVLDHVQME